MERASPGREDDRSSLEGDQSWLERGATRLDHGPTFLDVTPTRLDPGQRSRVAPPIRLETDPTFIEERRFGPDTDQSGSDTVATRMVMR